MEDFGEFPQGEWGGIMSSFEEAEFMAQLLGNCSLPNDDDSTNSSMHSSMSSFSGFDHFPFSTDLSHHAPLPNNNSTTMDYYTAVQMEEEESKKRCRLPCQVSASQFFYD